MQTTVSEKVILSSQVDAEMKDELRRRAAEGDRSLSAEVRRAITAYLEDYEKEES